MKKRHTYRIWSQNQNNPMQDDMLIEVFSPSALPQIEERFIKNGWVILKVDHTFTKMFIHLKNYNKTLIQAKQIEEEEKEVLSENEDN